MTTEKGSLREGNDPRPDENRGSAGSSRAGQAALGGLLVLGLAAAAVAVGSKGPVVTTSESAAAYCPPVPEEIQVSWPDTHAGAEFGVALSAVAVPSEVIIILPAPEQGLDRVLPVPVTVS
jgi:hypothetical protein